MAYILAEGLLYVDFSCYRSKDFELKDQQRNEDDSNDLFDIIDAEPVDKSITYPCKGVFLPECEEVVVLSNVRTSWKENLVSSAHSNQQRHGYMQYIPTNKEAFQEYWKYAYGIQLSDDFVDLMEVKTDLDQKVVPGSSVIR